MTVAFVVSRFLTDHSISMSKSRACAHGTGVGQHQLLLQFLQRLTSRSASACARAARTDPVAGAKPPPIIAAACVSSGRLLRQVRRVVAPVRGQGDARPVQRACTHRIPYKGRMQRHLASMCRDVCRALPRRRRRAPTTSGSTGATARRSSTATRSSSRATAQLRDGTAVAIFVTEDFSRRAAGQGRSRQARQADVVPVMKLNLVRDFQTGIYDYNTMTSTFLRTEFDAGDAAGR